MQCVDVDVLECDKIFQFEHRKNQLEKACVAEVYYTLVTRLQVKTGTDFERLGVEGNGRRIGTRLQRMDKAHDRRP